MPRRCSHPNFRRNIRTGTTQDGSPTPPSAFTPNPTDLLRARAPESLLRPSPLELDARYQNLSLVLRVRVLFMVALAGASLDWCEDAYCSLYASSEDCESIGTVTLQPRCARPGPVPMPPPS